jgi:hypothetical protein
MGRDECDIFNNLAFERGAQVSRTIMALVNLGA